MTHQDRNQAKHLPKYNRFTPAMCGSEFELLAHRIASTSLSEKLHITRLFKTSDATSVFLIAWHPASKQ
jgi:hypothetical protein